MMKKFLQDKAISLVFNSNKLGNTLPVGAKHSSTYKIMEAITKFTPTAITPWKSDGNSKLNPCQFIQHLKAYYYIMFIKKPLSVDNLLKTHAGINIRSLCRDQHQMMVNLFFVVN